MLKRGGIALALFLVCSLSAKAQSKLPVQWEDLTADDFIHAIHQAQGTCLLPFGILEKHGPQLPIGTDLINVRYASVHAAEEEYAVVFPAYYFGQIAEAKHQPGTIAYSRDMQLDLLQETTDEMARNGCKKILIVNGHGGNEDLLPYFAQTQLDKPHDYVVYIQWGGMEQPRSPLHKDAVDMHAGQSETSNMMVSQPDLVHMDRVGQESGADEKRLHLPPGVYTGIWWYARFPNHYAGDASTASKELGEDDMKQWIATIAEAIHAVKADDESLKLQNEFYEESRNPLGTKQ
ncbi:MAG TPA: creatininase family protein [Candidatus Acidoferrum sp.]|nr:creatininase family protein [Candidatus Acidoferrum sp.]